MIQTTARVLLVLALVFGGLVHAPMATAMTDGQMIAAVSSTSDEGDCDRSMAQMQDCLAACAVGCATLGEGAPMRTAALRHPWSADDRDASGILPPPALAPPRL